MKLKITPARLAGAVTPPPSKSQAHRLIIAAALADGESRLSNLSFSQDIEATLSCMETLGAKARRTGDVLTVTGIGPRRVTPPGALLRFDCGESGSTLRFLIPIALALAGGGVFTGRGRLPERPQGPYEELFRAKGISFTRIGTELKVEGRLEPGDFSLRGDVSSQFFTGLLYALPLLGGPSRIFPTTAVESGGYIDLTLEAMRAFGVPAREPSDGAPFFAVPSLPYRPHDCAVEADWSQAGFFYAAAGVGNDVSVTGMNPHSAQGDRVLEAWSARLRASGEVAMDVSGSPDLVPPLAVWAALRADETTRLQNAARLRIKESDRLETVARELNALGAEVEEGPDDLTIRGVERLRGGAVSSHNDHRIAMMLAVAATRADGPVLLEGAECVAKSYPDFWRVYQTLGGSIEEVPE